MPHLMVLDMSDSDNDTLSTGLELGTVGFIYELTHNNMEQFRIIATEDVDYEEFATEEEIENLIKIVTMQDYIAEGFIGEDTYVIEHLDGGSPIDVVIPSSNTEVLLNIW